MASSQLSPKKYIETRARTLPIYKCLLNKEWKAASEANVIVMRRHVNGNVTAGIYLIDLLCLGVKDTFYFFNEPEEDIYDRFPTDIEEMFDEVEYALAHNIIYAGHDFALDFGIEPDKEFAVTKFILEEDNDNIPIIEIPVGDENGLPHLMVHQPGEWNGALAKLQKNAGEGNYTYTVTGLSADNFEEEDDSYDDDAYNMDTERDIAAYDLGRITPYEAQFISDEELDNVDKVGQRTGIEKMTIRTEQALRNLREAQAKYFNDDIESTTDYALMEESETTAYGVTASEEDIFFENFEEEILKADTGKPDEKSNAYFQDLIDKHADKLLVMAAVFESECNSNGPLVSLSRSRLEDLQIYPLARLNLALANLLKPAPAPGYEDVYQERGIKKLFPEMDVPGYKDLAAFWLIQTVLHLRKNDLKSAIYYYDLFSETDIINFMMSPVQAALIEAINKNETAGGK